MGPDLVGIHTVSKLLIDWASECQDCQRQVHYCKLVYSATMGCVGLQLKHFEIYLFFN